MKAWRSSGRLAMSNQDGRNGDPRRALLSDNQSNGGVELGLVRALNERCLELMVQLARSDLTPVPTAVAENRNLWCGLDAIARKRAASHRALLLDISFADPTWWRCAADPKYIERRGAPPVHLPTKIASELMRETVMLAWIIVRADQGLATMLCGMAPPVARLFASFGTPDIERIATRHSRHLRLRFDDHPSFWRTHLRLSGSSPFSSALDTEIQHPENRQHPLF